MKAVLTGSMAAMTAMRAMKNICSATPANSNHDNQRPKDFIHCPESWVCSVSSRVNRKRETTTI